MRLGKSQASLHFRSAFTIFVKNHTAMIEISSNKFRQQPNKFFDLADQGERVVVRRRSGNSYTIAPNDDDEYAYDEATLNDIIDRGLKGIREGKGTPYNREEFAKRFGL